MAGDEDNQLPPEELAAELPPAEDVEPREFLVSESEPSEPLPGAEGEGGLPEPGAGESVDDLLSAEVLPEGLDALPALEPSPALPEVPTFQLQFRSLGTEARAALKKALEAQGVTVSEKAWAAAVPVVSQLSEFQAVVLLQAARALGAVAEASVIMPDALPTEDDLALGDLSNVPEASEAVLEAAPSVALPKGEKEVLLCTPDALPGGTVRESFGIVVAHRSIARRLFREEELRDKLNKELRAVPNRAIPGRASGASSTLPSSHLQILLRDLMLDLRKSALAKGANSVLGVKIEAFPESSTKDPQLEQLRLVAFGTAAVVEKS